MERFQDHLDQMTRSLTVEEQWVIKTDGAKDFSPFLDFKTLHRASIKMPMGDNGLIGSKIIIYLAINMDMAFNVEDDLS